MTTPFRRQIVDRRFSPILLAAAAVLLAAGFNKELASADEPAGSGNALTVYSTAAPGAVPPDVYRPVPGQGQFVSSQSPDVPGYAVVRQERDITIKRQQDTVQFTDVAALIDPTTVTFASLTDPEGTRVLEQNYQFDLVNATKLMERYIGREISIQLLQGEQVVTARGTLLSGTGWQLVLKGQDGSVQAVSGYASARFPELPEGLITKPTLIWNVVAAKTGPHRMRVTYQTGGITWWADYNVVFSEGKDANSGVLDVAAWVSILNQSGASYPEARLKLMGGDVHRSPRPGFAMGSRSQAGGMGGPPEEGLAEKAFFEYHLYTLGRSTTLPDNSTKQIELFPPVRGLPCEKVMVYYGLAQESFEEPGQPMTDRDLGTKCSKKVDVYLRFRNDKQHGMGMPLPAGRIRVSKMDPADKSLEFIGEDVIDHTPKDEEVLVKTGSAFDVVGERKQVDYNIDLDQHWLDETIEIKLRNHKTEPVKVIVKENLFRWLSWQITEKTHDFEKVDSRTIHFPVTVPKDGEATVTYKVHYTW